MSSNQDETIKFGVMLILGGAFGFYQGLKKLKLRRKMNDIPTSKIASAAVGSFVEIHAKVYGDKSTRVESPLSGKKVAAFIWELYQMQGSGKNRSWCKIHTYYSTPFLYLQNGDSPNLAALDLQFCDFQEKDYSASKTFDDRDYDIPLNLRKFLKDKNILDTAVEGSILFKEQYHLTERIFTSGESLYVLGTAISPPARKALKKVSGESFGEYNPKVLSKINTILHEARSDKELIQKYDRNGDSVLDRHETGRLRRDIESMMFESSGSESFSSCLENTTICFTKSKNNEKFFNIQEVIVSKQDEKKLGSKLMINAVAMIIGGPLAVIGGLWVLFYS